MVRLQNGKVKEESLKQELLQEQDNAPPEVQQEGDWSSRDVERWAAEQGRRESAVKVFVPTAASVFKWNGEGENRIEEVDEATIGLLDEHTLSVEDLGRRYCTTLNTEKPENSKGMDADRALQVLSMTGTNELTPAPTDPKWKIFLRELVAPLNMMLIVASAASFFIFFVSLIQSDTLDFEELQLGLVLVVVILLNTSIDFTQRQNAVKVLKSFSKLCPTISMVTRNGALVEVDSIELVMGDVVTIRAGDKIPADLRFIWCNCAKVDNSSLTGECAPLTRKAIATTDSSREAENMGFFGTTLVAGHAMGVVIRTGDRTTMGQIAAAAGVKSGLEGPLIKEIEQFVKMTAVIASITGVVFVTAGMLLVDADFITEFVFFVGLFVAFVPQGLPATVTMLLTFAAMRLKDCNVLVKDLTAVDTLGTITLLASDKTGTLTLNRMTVVDVWLNGKLLSTQPVKAGGSRKQEEFDVRTTPNAQAMLQCFLLNSTARFAGGSAEGFGAESKIIGDATESGMVRFAAAKLLGNEDVDGFRELYPKVMDVPFDSGKKWAMSIHKMNGGLTLFIKGAAERVIAMCSSVVGKGQAEDSPVVPLDAAFHRNYTIAYEDLAGRGERVLACAMLRLDRTKYPVDFDFNEDNIPSDGFAFIGLVGLRDPPKPGVREAILECHSAGVQVVMVTGDHPLTAEAIARQVGIIRGETKAAVAARRMVSISEVPVEDYECAIVHGDEIDELTAEQWNETLQKKDIVFARTTPQHKLEIVTRFQALGHIVSVTGDGVNDSPALKRSDMGVAMALTGSDVSKEAASIIILDDNFASVVMGIREGRLVFHNLKKSIMYTLCHIVPEVVPFLFYVTFSIPVAINSFLILCVDLGTEIAPALSFAWEAGEDDIMEVEPRRFVKPQEPAVVAGRDEMEALAEIEDFEVEEVDILKPENQAVAHRLGFFWFSCRKRKVLGGNLEDDILVDNFVYSWSYCQAGIIISIAALTAFFWEMHLNDVCASDLMWASVAGYFNTGASDFTTCTGRVLDCHDQLEILMRGQSAYFTSIVVCQFFDAYVCKTRKGLPFGSRFFINKRTYVACFFSACMATFIVHCPGVRYVLYARPFNYIVIICPIIGGCCIILYESIRRTLFPNMGIQTRKRVMIDRGRHDSVDLALMTAGKPSGNVVHDMEKRGNTAMV